MRIADDVVIQKVADFYVAVATGARAKDLPCMMRLNESGAFLWNKCTEIGSVDEEELSAALVEEYGIGEDVAKRDAAKFVKSLADNGLLV